MTNRQLIRDDFRNQFNKIKQKYENTQLSEFVYAENKFKVVNATNSEKFSNIGGEIVVLFPDKNIPLYKDIKKSLVKTFDRFNIKYKFVDDYKNPKSTRDSQSKKAYDIELTGVGTGKNMHNWVIDMMWCSNMGVSFSDPEGSMCKLVKDKMKAPFSPIGDNYKKKFNQIVENDATVIPLFHRGPTYLVDKKLSKVINGDLEKIQYLNLIDLNN